MAPLADVRPHCAFPHPAIYGMPHKRGSRVQTNQTINEYNKRITKSESFSCLDLDSWGYQLHLKQGPISEEEVPTGVR